MNGIHIYTKFKNGIFNYLGWFKFIQLSKNNKESGLVKDMFINVSTKYKDIINVKILKINIRSINIKK